MERRDIICVYKPQRNLNRRIIVFYDRPKAWDVIMDMVERIDPGCSDHVNEPKGKHVV